VAVGNPALSERATRRPPRRRNGDALIAIRRPEDLAEILRRIREYQGLTADELGRRVYADRRTIRGRDTGTQGYTAAALIETAAALGYTVALIPHDQAQEAA